MTSTRVRLILLKGASEPDWASDDTPGSFKSAFEIIEVENVERARRLLKESPPGSVLVTPELALALGEVPAPSASGPSDALLRHIGEGLGIVDDQGRLIWSDDRLDACDEPLKRSVVDCCGKAIELMNRISNAGLAAGSRKFAFSGGNQRYYELTVSPASVDPSAPQRVTEVVGVLWDVTESRLLQQKINAIDSAGSELMRIEAESISTLNMAERLRLLEEKIVQYAHDLLQFDNFEIRLLDRVSNRLELVVAVGISPLKIGEVIHAELEGNGISGYVACTGQSYICPNVRRDPLYREGLDNAASSLTVPLRLHDEIIGVFNVESNTLAAFDEDDLRFAEIFGRYVAMAMHILDLLVVERYTTNEEVSENVLAELSVPIDEVAQRVEALLKSTTGDEHLTAELIGIHKAAAQIRRRMEASRRGPRTIYGAEQELQRHETDPLMVDRRILIADNEPEIRETMQRILAARLRRDGLRKRRRDHRHD